MRVFDFVSSHFVKFCFVLAMIISAFSTDALTSIAHGQSIKTDRAVYAEPSLPTLPAAGGKYTDPVFGTLIMRATDQNDGPAPGLGTHYSHWPTFNCNNTKIFIRKGITGDAIIKNFDPVNFTIGAATTLPNSLPGGSGPSWESSIWSNTDPNIIYTFAGYYTGGMKLYSFNVSSGVFTLIKDLSLLSGGNDFLKQMYMSADNDVFCWLIIRSGVNEGDPISYLVYRRSTDTVLFHNSATVYTGGVNEVHVDKSGKWLHITIPTPQADGTGSRILNLQTGAYQPMTASIDHIPGHGDLGTETIIGFDNYNDGISTRRLDSVHEWENIILFRTASGVYDWSNDFHGTMLADNEDWITIGTFDDPTATGTETGIFEDEIIQVATDGSESIRRLLHTRSAIEDAPDTTGYWATPKPTISKDGRYIAYTSNWEKSGRYDLFIAKIEPAPVLTQPNSSANVTWTNVVNATASGSSLTPTAANARGESSQSIQSGNGSIKVTATNGGQTGYTYVGLMNGTFTGALSEIDYGWLIYNGMANCRINGDSLNSTIPTVNGDTFEVKINGTTVEWYRNNSLVISLTGQTLTYPYRAAAVLNEPTSPRITNAQMTGVASQDFWTNVTNATASGSSLTPTAANARGESSQSIQSGNGSIKVTATNGGQTGYTYVGLMNGTFTGALSEIDYGWLIYNGMANCRINGDSLNSTIPTVNGDTFEVKINGTTVEWYRNNTLVISLTGQALTYSYRAAAVLNEPTSPRITNAQMTGSP